MGHSFVKSEQTVPRAVKTVIKFVVAAGALYLAFQGLMINVQAPSKPAAYECSDQPPGFWCVRQVNFDTSLVVEEASGSCFFATRHPTDEYTYAALPCYFSDPVMTTQRP